MKEGETPANALRLFRCTILRSPACIKRSRSPMKKAASPALVMTKAFLPAWVALNLSYQKPISR